MVAQQAALERRALEQLRRGDLRGAHGTLAMLAQLRPNDAQITRRLEQVDGLLRRRAEAKAKMQAEPLRYAHAYIKAGRLEDGLRLLRAALGKDPSNERLRELALQVARRLDNPPSAQENPGTIAERKAAEAKLRAQTEARRSRRPGPALETRAPSAIGRPPPPPVDSEELLTEPPTRPIRIPSAPSPVGSVPDAPRNLLEARGPQPKLELLLRRVRTRRRSPSLWLDEPETPSPEGNR